jgi:hypothetical protein
LRARHVVVDPVTPDDGSPQPGGKTDERHVHQGAVLPLAHVLERHQLPGPVKLLSVEPSLFLQPLRYDQVIAGPADHFLCGIAEKLPCRTVYAQDLAPDAALENREGRVLEKLVQQGRFLGQGLLGGNALRHVVDDGVKKALPLEGNYPRVNLNVAQRAVRKPVEEEEITPFALLRAPHFLPDLGRRQGIDLHDGHAAELFPGVAVETHRRLVAIDDPAPVRVDQQHDGVVLLEKALEAALTLCQGLHGAILFRHVADDRREAVIPALPQELDLHLYVVG